MTGPALDTVVFIGFAVPDDVFDVVLRTDRGMPVQTHRFGWSFVSALQAAGLRVRVVSAEPVSDFPHNRRAVLRGRSFEARGVRGNTITFVNITGLKHVTRFCSAYRSARQLRSEAGAIFVHGVHSPFLWVAVRLGRAWKVPVVAVVTDAPSTRTHRDTWATRAMKVIDRMLILRALRRLSGVVALTEALASDFAPGRPYLLMEGIAERPPSTGRRRSTSRLNPTVVYAGGLHESYGVRDLLEAVRESKGSWNLEFYGRGPAEELIRGEAARNSRVRFGGFVEPAGLADLYARADVLVNPRPPETELTRYSFPSKLLEYLASGTPVVTTRISNMPTDYLDHLTVAEAGGVGLALAIDGLSLLPEVERRARGVAAAKFIERTRGVGRQGQRLVDFLGAIPPPNW